jgi:hypothetical protein
MRRDPVPLLVGLTAALVEAGLFILSAMPERHDVLGAGPQFEMNAKVVGVDGSSVQLSDINLLVGEPDWRREERHEVLDYYETCGWWWASEVHHVGVVTREGRPATIAELRAGDFVKVRGENREAGRCGADRDGPDAERWPVFDTLDVIPG